MLVKRLQRICNAGINDAILQIFRNLKQFEPHKFRNRASVQGNYGPDFSITLHPYTLMIQRIQSIFLLLAAICTSVVFFIPYAGINSEKGHYDVLACAVHVTEGTETANEVNTLPTAALTTVTALLPIFIVFLFRKRLLQIKLSRLAIFLNSGLLALMFVYADNIGRQISGSSTSYQAGFIFPVLAIIFLFIAIKYVKKDEALVRSADRIR